MPSALKPNHMFLVSPAKSPYFLSIFLHCHPSASALNFPSFLRSSLCHRINLACSLFLNRCFNRGIIGAYHITLAGTLFLGGSPSTSPGSSRLILYRNAPHTGHAFKSSYAPRQRMQSLGHACIFCTSNPRGHTTFFAAYVLSGNSLSFESFFFNIFSSFSNPLSGTAFSAFHCSNSSTVPSFVLPSSQLGYNPFCDPLTCDRTSTSPCLFRILSVHQQC